MKFTMLDRSATSAACKVREFQVTPPNPACTQPPAKYAGTIVVVGLPPAGTACAFSGSFRGLEMAPVKWRPLPRPAHQYPTGHNASRWALTSNLHPQGMTIARQT